VNQGQNESISLEIGIPKLYKLREVIIANLISLFPSIVAGGLFSAGVTGFFGLIILLFLGIIGGSLVILPLSLALLSILISISVFYFTPLWGGVNFYVKLIVKRINLPETPNGFIFQFAADPRLFKGLRGFLEDADDIGILSLQEEALSFKGDCINLCIPYSRIESVQKYNVGWRGIWICGKRIKIKLKNYKQYNSFEFLERHSYTVPKSNMISNEVASIISEKIKNA